MAYSNFTLEGVVTAFQLEIVESAALFAEAEAVTPSAHLTTALAKKTPLATAISTEKARSELIVADVLVELREHCDQHISFFSGTDFSVDPEEGLTGVCDFLVSLSPNQFYGASTTGIDWLFLKLEGKGLHIDMVTYTIERCDRILGILASMVAQKA